MENQHEKITGYRSLSQPEIDLMNEGKALADQVGAYIGKLRALRLTAPADLVPDPRWVAIGETNCQQGFMALIRSIAKPTSF